MKRSVILGVLAAGIIALLVLRSGNAVPSERGGYLGFDRNDYPGNESLKGLRQTFSFSGYWLNNPPRASSNSWRGKRKILQKAGFGLLVIFNGRTDAEIKASGNATKVGSSDAASAISSARREGFPPGTIIFLDQEEGGRLLPEQQDYLHAWIDGVVSAGFRAGVYCSGVAFKEASGTSVITAENIRENAGGRKLTYWVSNDACPPSPGCAFAKKAPTPAASGISFAAVWQFTQSPRRNDFASGCSNYSDDGNCYPPSAGGQQLHIDIDVASSTDPSHSRTGD